MVVFRKWTEPSAKAKFAPPGCRLTNPLVAAPNRQPGRAAIPGRLPGQVAAQDPAAIVVAEAPRVVRDGGPCRRLAGGRVEDLVAVLPLRIVEGLPVGQLAVLVLAVGGAEERGERERV